MVVTANAIRVQLPGGTIYTPAFVEAASKTGARSGLPARTAKAFAQLVEQSVVLLNGAGAATIVLEMQVHNGSFQGRVVGRGTGAPTKNAVKELEALAAKRAKSFETKVTKSALTISFEA